VAPPRSTSELAQLAVRVNGEDTLVRAGTSVAELLGELGFGGRRVAVAVNREVVPRAAQAERRIAAGDRIEILEAVGGG
jgi:sulfur carrier protein